MFGEKISLRALIHWQLVKSYYKIGMDLYNMCSRTFAVMEPKNEVEQYLWIHKARKLHNKFRKTNTKKNVVAYRLMLLINLEVHHLMTWRYFLLCIQIQNIHIAVQLKSSNATIASLESCKISQVSLSISEQIVRETPLSFSRGTMGLLMEYFENSGTAFFHC